MILDAFWLFTGGAVAPGNNDGLTDSPTTGTQNSSNIVDLAGPALPPSSTSLGGLPGRDLGIGDDPALKLMIIVTVAFTSGTSLQIGVQGAPDNGSGVPGSYTTIVTGQVVTEASLSIGARLFDIDFPRTGPLAIAPPRFIRLTYINAGTHVTGKIEGLFVLDRMDQIVNVFNNMSGYPAGITIAN